MKNAVKLLFSTFLIFTLLSGLFSPCVNAEDVFASLYANGNIISEAAKPFIRDGITYADLKVLAESFSIKYNLFNSHGSATIDDGSIAVCFTSDENYATICDLTGSSEKEYTYHELSGPCILTLDEFYVPVRDFAELFGIELTFNKESQTIFLGEHSIFSPEDFECGVYSQIPDGTIYYFQNQQDFQLPDYGSGYCWVCSYSMLITSVTKKPVIPNDIANVNLEYSSQGSYCYHSEIVSRFGVEFVPALSETSVFYKGIDPVSGGTYINNPDSEDRVAIAAIKQALLLHPDGVMVRYAVFPHTMVATGFVGDIIYFNDPAPSSSGSYAPTGKYQGIPFEKTCVAKKGFKISDLTFIQALKEK